jgi:hypothetical protein
MYVYITEAYDDRVHRRQHVYAYEVLAITRGFNQHFRTK